MKTTLPKLRDLARRWPPGRSRPETVDSAEDAEAEPVAEPKPPPPPSTAASSRYSPSHRTRKEDS